MHVSYIVSAYKNPEQLIRLVDRLDAPDVTFFVHVDRKSADGVFRRIAEGLANRTNVVLLPRHRCEWGGFGHVEATLEGIRAALESTPPIERAVLLTGQDYPIKSNRCIVEFFATHPDDEFLEHFPVPHAEWQHDGLDRIEGWHWRVRGRHVSVQPRRGVPLQRRMPDGLRPYGGSSYWCLTRDCLAYVSKYIAAHPSVVRFFRHVDVPDELFFQTIVLNSPFADRVVNDNRRFIVWDDDASASPAILRMDHFDDLASSPALFARKFDLTVDARVLDRIDRTLLSEANGGEVVVR